MSEEKNLLPFKRPKKRILDDDDIPLGKGKPINKTTTESETKTTKKAAKSVGEKASGKKKASASNEPKRHTFFVDPEILEKVKDLVLTRKYTQGDIEVNQSTIINEALEKYLEAYEGKIQSRPKYIRDIEEKKARRPNTKK